MNCGYLREIIMSGYIKEEEDALIHEDSTVISALTLPTLPSHQSASGKRTLESIEEDEIFDEDDV